MAEEKLTPIEEASQALGRDGMTEVQVISNMAAHVMSAVEEHAVGDITQGQAEKVAGHVYHCVVDALVTQCIQAGINAGGEDGARATAKRIQPTVVRLVAERDRMQFLVESVIGLAVRLVPYEGDHARAATSARVQEVNDELQP